MCRWVFAAVLVFGLIEPAQADSNKRLAEFIALTPQHFQDTAVVKDDELETSATIDTSLGFKNKQGLMKVVWDDNFLRAFIDKKTGATTYQLYQIIRYSGQLRRYDTVNYETPDGPASTEVTVIDQNVDGCSRYGCSYTETIGFALDENLMRTIASMYQPGAATAWRFKFKSQSGNYWQDGMMPSEIAGLLAAVDGYKVGHALP